jgi:glycine/D-amino acid oxidase-like deaminating enzyme
MLNTANPTSRRIGQLIRMLSSDQPGEVAAAGQALNKALASVGLDIHALANVVEAGLRLPAPTEQPVKKQRPATTTNKARRPDGRPLQMDEKLVCDQQDGVFRACGCGGILFTVMPGVGPHVAQLACGRGGRWLSRRYFGATS